MRLVVCVGVLVLALASAAFAQQGGVAGTVRDPQQAVVPGAVVALSGSGTAVRTVTTDADGRYRFTSVVPGTYVVEVRATGFQVATSPALTVAGSALSQDFALVLAGASESVTVTANAINQGYRASAVSSLGSSGNVAILDAPYTLNVLPGTLMENGQVKNFKEASKFLPLVQFQEMQGSEILRPATRGMQGSNMQNARMDGMGIVVTGANSIESLEQIEVLSGVGAAEFGPANPSGMFNFVPKRPTARDVRNVTIGYDDDGVGTIRADAGGRAGTGGRFGYRANVLYGDGEAFVKNSESKRGLASLAVDVRPFDHTVIEGFYSYYDVVQRGFPGWFTYGRANARSAFILLPPDAPDPSTPGLGQRSAGVDLTSNIGEVRVRQDLNSNWKLTAGLLDQRADRSISTQVNALTSSAGAYTSSLAIGFAPQFRVLSDLASVSGHLQTGAVRHEIAVGTAGYTFDTYSDLANPSAASVLLGSASIGAPIEFALPPAGIPQHNNLFQSSTVRQQGINASDTAIFNRYWSVRVGVSQDWIQADSVNSTAALTSSYRANGPSPSTSVMFKPAANMTLYSTYASSLQQGDIAGTATANPGTALPPYRTHQVEAGYKISLGQIDFTTAAFRLDRPFANTDPADNVFKISGNQINDGVEAMVRGKLTDRLTTSSGVTFLNPRLTNTGNPATDGQQFVGIPRYRSDAFFEYRVPAGGSATFVNVNWQLVGARPIDDINSSLTPAYNIIDLGVRYARLIVNRMTTWRLSVNNVGDVHYWSTLGPGNITGTNVGSYTAHLGLPRTIAASMEVAF